MGKKLFILVSAIFVITSVGFSQTAFYAVSSGNWNATNIWSTDGITPIVCAPCTAGIDYPGALDDAYTNGFNITVTAGATCKNLAVSYNVSPSLTFGSLLTVTGTLAGWDHINGIPTAPDRNVFSGTPLLRFTAANLDGANPFLFLVGDEIIAFWNKNSPLGNATLQITRSCVIDGGDMLFGGDSELQFTAIALSGGSQFELATGSNLTALRASGNITIAASTILSSNVPISGTGVLGTSRFGTLSLTGRLTTSSYVNATTVTVAATTGYLETLFNGANQTQGWWFGTNAPTTITLNSGSTIHFNYEGAQIVPTRTYSNLILDGSGTKTLASSGTFLVTNLSILSDVTLVSTAATSRSISGNLVCDGTWQPVLSVIFSGSTTQSISGSGGTLNFTGGISKSAASVLTFNRSLSIGNGVTVSAGTLNLGDVTTTLNSGSFNTTGTTSSGTSGTLIVNGSSTFSGSGSLTINNLTVSGTGAAIINNTAWSVTGSISNSGSITLPSTSTVTFSGGNAQTISGNAISFGNITVNKTSSTLSNNSNVELLGVLTMTNGTFDADGSGSGIFTLNSDTNGDAAIGAMAGGSITGEVTFERYFDNTSNRWRNLSFPVSSVTYSELGSTLTLNTNSLSTYTESTLGNVNQGWVIVSGGTLNSSRGHSAWMYNIQPITISVRGPLLRGTPAQSGSPYNFGVTYTNDPAQPATEDGWNFIPNPFASPIDWNNSGWVKTNVNAAAAVWDVENNVYRYSNVDWNGVVAAGQAFWVQTNAASPVLTCTESAKESVSDPEFYRIGAENSRLMISLKSGNNIDKTVLQFKEEATPDFDGNFDTYKLKNGIYNLSTLSNDGISLAANVMPASRCTSGIKLNVTDIEPGAYTFKFEGLGSFSNVNSILLKDKFTNDSYELQEEGMFTFQVTNDPNSFGTERFELVFDFTDLKPNPVIGNEENQLISNYEEGNQWYLNGEAIEGATGKGYTPLRTGVYFVSVSDGACILKSEEKVVEEVASRIFPNPASEQLKVDVGGFNVESGEILIYSSLGLLVKKETFTMRDYLKEIDLRDVRPGIYSVTIISANKAILGKSKVVIK